MGTKILEAEKKLQACGFKYEKEFVDGEPVAIYHPTKESADLVVKQNGGKLFFYLGRKAQEEFNNLPRMKVDDLPGLDG